MSKFRGLFGPRPGAVTLVDAPVSRTYARKARVAFFAVAAVVAVLAAVVLSRWLPAVAGVLLGVLLGVVAGLLTGVVVMAWPVLRVLWHWAAEITFGAGLVAGWSTLAGVTAGWVSLLVVLALGVLAVAVVPVRRRLVAWAWCLIVRHRLRLCFAQVVRSTSRTGHAPLVLLARPTPAGERVWVWLRPGLDVADLEGQTARLAVACWADQVRVARASSSYAALVRVDIARRDPLGGVVRSPLVGLVPEHDDASAPVSPGLPPLGLDLDDVPEPPTGSDRGRQMRKSRGGSDRGPGPTGDDDAFI